MTVSAVTPSNSAYTPKAASSDQISNPSSTMGKTDFLQMLITKLKYQDPTNPVSDSNFTSEMAQYSTLEQMQNMNSTSTASAAALSDLNTNIVSLIMMQNTTQAAGLIGKTVAISTSVTDSTGAVVAGPDVTGTVSIVKFVNGQPKVVVNGIEYGLASIKEIRA
jgi:flagellar basal-body rod modification protein FlgD